jgi:simple sugar transport system permease protein
MSDDMKDTPPPVTPPPEQEGEPPKQQPGGYAPSVAEKFDFYARAGGLVTPLITTILAFFIGGLVVLITTGKNPLSTYKAIFDGTGLNWFFQVGSYSVGVPGTDWTVWFPWNTNSFQSHSAYNLQTTLVLTTALIFTGLAVAFAFRCGLFNIGGQGQYMSGAIVAVWIGGSFAGMAHIPHATLTIVCAALAGALLAGIAGILKATVGAHEVIVTIMLNWIVFWIGSFLFGLDGPLQNDNPLRQAEPISNDVAESSKLHVFWGNPVLQGLHIGFLLALVAIVVYWLLISRTTLGFEVRGVGYNPDAARYGGIAVGRNYFLAMAIAGVFAGVGGAVDILGWQYRLAVNDVQTSQIGFIGIAVALLGRNTPIGVGLSALLFGALLNGTSTRNLDPDVFRPELADNLATLIQGLVVLFVGADLLVIYLWQARKKLKPKRAGGSAVATAPEGLR